MPLKPHERHVLDFLLKHLLYGTFGGFLFGGLLLATDLGGIRTLVMASEDTVLFLILLFFGLFVTFGSVGMGVGIMSLGEDKN
ncbi:MAG: hypothetical protein LDL26_03565 [Caenispirillum bisanense]|uniref:Uncharacterized protein n=1 Tax=Caenispirillum bisanense TaxID=414052 RepID=A0A286GBD9_9PROT|nr:hypothetical protein [Caenispirillum bisanense]MCA1940053.1 hypothetical protein [Caenispirillum bisanense]MCA1972317.1 hypothetical protein [Caenispirillum sp.]SOD92324.1 hypothetical protein SAMN05421508_102377 [Caenispirillum bisanense]